jgi:predicted ATP-dependent endonuclease of OLD family
MRYSKIEINGYRGFSSVQTLNLAIQSGLYGSGLTVVLGPNNSGKSTIFEAFKGISQTRPPSITEGRRNKAAGEKINIKLFNIDDLSISLETVPGGGSETRYSSNGIKPEQVKIMALPSRRTFSPLFSKGLHNRDQFINSSGLPPVRGAQLDNFQYRIFNIQQSPEQFAKFNSVLSKVLKPVPNWHIEQNDGGQYYIKFIFDGFSHNSDGAGEGLLSLFTIVDTLYDSSDDDIIIIDEPELSLHPSLQRRLISLISDYAKTRQIVIFTHSPYFIDWQALFNGGSIARTKKESTGELVIQQMKRATIEGLFSLYNNMNNPHILGLDAREIFFLDENVILVEGQEDVIFFKRILELLKIDLHGSFYGWGAGGATNMTKILNAFVDLGFKKVCVILDKNMESLKPGLENDFPNFVFFIIPTDDVRDKDEIKGKPAISGLIDRGGKNIKPEYEAEVNHIFKEINAIFQKHA